MHDVEVLMGGAPTIKVRTQARMRAVCVPLGREAGYSAAHNWL